MGFGEERDENIITANNVNEIILEPKKNKSRL
jgi:hypothetical protein